MRWLSCHVTFVLAAKREGDASGRGHSLGVSLSVFCSGASDSAAAGDLFLPEQVHAQLERAFDSQGAAGPVQAAEPHPGPVPSALVWGTCGAGRLGCRRSASSWRRATHKNKTMFRWPLAKTKLFSVGHSQKQNYFPLAHGKKKTILRWPMAFL